MPGTPIQIIFEDLVKIVAGEFQRENLSTITHIMQIYTPKDYLFLKPAEGKYGSRNVRFNEKLAYNDFINFSNMEEK